MRKRTERKLAVTAVAVVAAVPTALVLIPWDGSGGSQPAAGTAPMAEQAAAGDPKPVKSSGLPSPAQGKVSKLPTANPTGSPGPTPTWLPTNPPGGGNGGLKNWQAADDGAVVTAAKWAGKNQVDLSVKSPALASVRKVRVLVPNGWKSKSTQEWPALYALHGGNDTYVSWTRSTDIAKVARQWGVIVVMPEGSNGSYTDWYNGGRGGSPRWETFHTAEVRQLVERNLHAGSSRAVMGISSGAQGAVTYAARHPGMFRYAASYSGVLSMLSPGIPALLMYINTRPGTNPMDIWGDPWTARSNWAAHDPASLARRLRGTTLFVSAGNGSKGPLDKPGKAPWDIGYLSETQVLRSSGDFVSSARKSGVPVQTDFYGAGSHSWPYWQREMHKTWAEMMASIGAKRA
ncbi:alpha/beta hydrolase [Actinomadura rupiterrae]|uniref:alpha/beta hydrolase n=1 Tax=Actinomadura rupiterrae TaxID=559627 RepID=UPI0020A27D00|nr:alpha/beta hydrolase family protein [Actinomadura rupiterrae]MCP2341940.1 S-formylglutathione hydrolase FrmB [Actinomadura rupiterrae]